MRKLLLASCAVFALCVGGGFAQAHDPAPDTTVKATKVTSVRAALADSVVGSGSLSESSTNTHSLSYTTTASGGAGSSFNTASLTGNHVTQNGSASAGSGAVTMTYSMGGQGILQANQNSGANAVQQNSVALTSTVGGNGGGLNGFSPTTTAR